MNVSKFKVGDRVLYRLMDDDLTRIVTGYEDGDVRYDSRLDGHLVGNFRAGESDLDLIELVTPTEHPALTLAKAEVAQLVAVKDRNDLSEYGQHSLRIHLEYLRAFGLEYRAKPVVPQPVEYEFVPVRDVG